MHKSSNTSNFAHIADDSTVFCHGLDSLDLVNNSNAELNNIYNQLISNKLSLNLLKTSIRNKTSVFNSHNQIPANKVIKNINHEISMTKTINLLCIVIDDKLPFEYYIAQLGLTISRLGLIGAIIIITIGVIYMLRNIISFVMICVIYLVVFPLNYE